MSDYLAIGGVAQTLRALLKYGTGNAVSVTFCPPDLKPNPTQAKNRINLYLYRVEENAYLRNQEIPGHGHPGTYGNPPLSLILFYLMTAFVKDENHNEDYDLEVHNLISRAMRVFHDYPIITDSMEVPPGSGIKLLKTSLPNQFENIKITHQPLDTEELTKIWMGMTCPYRLSVGYTISVVQIESKKPRTLARTVRTRQLHLIQLQRPQITDILVEQKGVLSELPPATVRIGDKLILHGAHLKGLSTQILIGENKFDVIPISDSQIEFEIKDDPTQPGFPQIHSGPTGVGVIVEKATEIVKGGFESLGENATGSNVVSSNQLALMVVPKITMIKPEDGDHTTLLTVYGKKLYKKGLQTFVLIGDICIPVTKLGITDIEAARGALEFGIRRSKPTDDKFHKAFVTILNNRLLILPGVTGTTVELSASGSDPALNELKLNATLPVKGALSKGLSSFNGFSEALPKIRIKIGSGSYKNVDVSPVTDIKSLREALESGIHVSDPGNPAFSNARVLRLDDRLLVVSGNVTDTIAFLAAPGDTTTLSELGINPPDSVTGVLSGPFTGFTGLTNDPAKLRVRMASAGPWLTVIMQYPTEDSIQVPLTALKDEPKKVYPVRVRTNGGESVEDKINFELT